MHKESLQELAIEASGVGISEQYVEALTRLLGNIRRGLQGFDGLIARTTEPASVFRAADPAGFRAGTPADPSVQRSGEGRP